MVLLIAIFATCSVKAQTDQFRVLDGVPHLPVVANTASVSTPETGMLVYSSANGSPMIFDGGIWLNLCETSSGVSGSGYFKVKNKISYLPVNNSLSITPESGSVYLSSSSNTVKVYDGSSWFDVTNLNSGSFSTRSGFSSKIEAIQLPVLANDPSPVGLSAGAIYINTGVSAIKYYNGSSWQTLTCNFAPVANSVTITVDDILKENFGLTGNYSYSDTEGDSESGTIKQWYRADNSGGTNRQTIIGQNATNYTLTSFDVNKYITYGVTPGASSGSTPGTEVFATYKGPVLANELPVASSVIFAGVLKNTETLSGTYTYSDAEGDAKDTPSLKWYRADNSGGFNQVEISLATASSYTLATADVGKYVAYAVKPAALSGNSPGVEVLSAYQGPILENAAPVFTSVSVSGGTLQAGYSLTAIFSGYSDADSDPAGTHTYKWYTANDIGGAGQTIIGGENLSSYLLQSGDVGKFISVGITPVAASGTSPGTEVLANYIGPILPNQAPVITNLSIPSSLFQTATVNASYTYNDNEGDAQGSHIYNWELATDNTGSGATSISTSSTYNIPSADIGKYLKLTMTPKAATGEPTGLPVQTSWEGPILECGGTISHNGTTYNTVLLTPAGKDASCWMKESIQGSFSGIVMHSSNSVVNYYSAKNVLGNPSVTAPEKSADYRHETSLCPSGWALPSYQDFQNIRGDIGEISKLYWNIGGYVFYDSWSPSLSINDSGAQYILGSNFSVDMTSGQYIQSSTFAYYFSGVTVSKQAQIYNWNSSLAWERAYYYQIKCVRK